MIRIHCDAAHAVLKETEILTAGMLNYPTVQLTYTDELAPYGKAAIVRAGTVERAVAITEDSFLVPSECLASSGVNLIIGIRFVGSSSVIPTMWCDCGMIYDGADPDQGSTGEATQDLVDQMIAYAEQIAESAEAYDQSIIRQVIANANNANQYGTANVTVADTGSGSNRTLTFYFSNLKGNGIESVSWVTSGEYKGRLQIREVNGTVTNFDAFIQPLANIEAMDSTAEESAEAAATSESNAEAWAVGERGGTPVDSADETYHNNSKYYADQASDYADAALDAANRAIAATGLEIDTVLDPTSVNPVRNMAIAEAINNLNDGKVDKAAGKQLSTEDYTTTEKNKLAGIASGAQVNTITGVKGDAESSYRTGDVNLTPANIGAVPATRTVNGKALSSNISLNSTDIIDDSDVGGSTVKASLNALKGSLNTLSQNAKYDITEPGTYNLSKVIAAGYITGSGNYFDFQLPIAIKQGLQISAVTLTAQNTNYVIVAPSQRIEPAFSDAAVLSYEGVLRFPVIDARFLQSQTPSTLAIAIVALSLTVTTQ